MKNFYLLVFFFLCAGFAVGQNKDTLITDNYPITTNMLKNYPRELSVGNMFAFDKAWFVNDSINQALVVDLATDYHCHRLTHFYIDDVPENLINEMWKITLPDSLPLKNILTNFQIMVKKGKPINRSYFTTNKGIQLGDDKQKFLKIYNIPDSYAYYGVIEKLEWWFDGEYFESDFIKPETPKPIAKESFGYRVTAYFRNDKLIAMMLQNDIP
ncbi:MAG: hypothetical protein AB7G44_05950 [Bacteroidia bacterium]